MAKITQSDIDVRLEGVATPTANSDAANKSYVDAREHGTGNLADGSVTTPKLADDAVTAAKIADGAVGTAQIADDAVTSTKISFNLDAIGNVSSTAPSNNQVLTWSSTNSNWQPGSVTVYNFTDSTNNNARLGVQFDEAAGGVITGLVDATDIVTSFRTGTDNTDTDITFSRFSSGFNSDWVARLKDNTVDVGEINAVRDSTPLNDANKVLRMNNTGTGLEWSTGGGSRVESFTTAALRNASTINWFEGDIAIVTADGNNNGAYVYDGTSPDLNNTGTSNSDWIDISGSVDTDSLTPAELKVESADNDFPNTGDRLVLAKGDDSFEAIVVGDGLELSGDDLQVDLDGSTLARGSSGIKVDTDGITSTEIADNAVVTAAINADAVTQAKIADDAVGADQLASNAVVTASIVDDAVTQDKLADNSVGNAQMRDNAIGNAEMADDAIGPAEINATQDSTPANDAHRVLALDSTGTALEWAEPGADHIANDSITPEHLDVASTDTDFTASSGQTLVSAHNDDTFEAVVVGDRLELNTNGNRINVDPETFRDPQNFTSLSTLYASTTRWYKGNLATVEGAVVRTTQNGVGGVAMQVVRNTGSTTTATISNVTASSLASHIRVGAEISTSATGTSAFTITAVGTLSGGNVTVTATLVPSITTATNAFFTNEFAGENAGTYMFIGSEGDNNGTDATDWQLLISNSHNPPKEDFGSIALRNANATIKWNTGDICSVAEEVYVYTGPTTEITDTNNLNVGQNAYSSQLVKGPTTVAEWTQIGFTGLKGDTIVDSRNYTHAAAGFLQIPAAGRFTLVNEPGNVSFTATVADDTPFNATRLDNVNNEVPVIRGLTINNVDSDGEPFRAINSLVTGSVVGLQSEDGRDLAFWTVANPDDGFVTSANGRFIGLGQLRSGSTGTYRHDATYRVFMIPREVPISAQSLTGEGVKNRTRFIAGDGSFQPAPIYTFDTYSKGLVPPTNVVPAIPMPDDTARSSQVFGYDEGAAVSGNILASTSLPQNTWWSLNGPTLPTGVSAYNAIMYPSTWNWATDGNIFAMMRCQGFSSIDVNTTGDDGFRGWIDSSKSIINFTIGGSGDITNINATFTVPTRAGTENVTITSISGSTTTAVATSIAGSSSWASTAWVATSSGSTLTLTRRLAGATTGRTAAGGSFASGGFTITNNSSNTNGRDGIDCPAVCYRDGDNWAIFNIGEFAVSTRDTGDEQPQVYFTLDSKGRSVGGPQNRGGDTRTEWYFGLERNRTAAYSATAGRTDVTEGSALATTLFLRSDGNWAAIGASQLDANVIEPNAGLRFYPGATGGTLGLSPAFIQAASTLALTTSYQYSTVGTPYTSTGDGTNGQVSFDNATYSSGAVTPDSTIANWADIRSISITRYDLDATQVRSIASLSSFISTGAILEVRRDASNYAVWSISGNVTTNGNANIRTFNVTDDFTDSSSNDQYGNDIFVGLIESQGTPVVTDDTAYTIIIHGNDEGKDGRLIFDNTINTAKLRDDSVTSAKIATNAVTADGLADNAVDTNAIVNLNVTRGKIAADAIDGTKLADDAVDNEHIADDAVRTAQIQNDAVDRDKIAADVAGAGLGQNTDGSLEVNVDNGLQVASDNVGIADDGVTGAKLAAAIAANGLTQDANGNLNVGAGTGLTVNADDVQITDAGVDTTQLADSAVTTAKIADDAVTGAKLAAAVADNGLTQDSDGNLNVGAGTGITVNADDVQITDGGVGTTQLANLGVTNAKIANDTIAGGKLNVTGTRSDTNRFLTLDSSDNITLGSVVGDGHVTKAVIESLIGDTETLVSHAQLTFDNTSPTIPAGTFRLYDNQTGNQSDIMSSGDAFSDVRRLDIHPPSSGPLAGIIGDMVVGSVIHLRMGTSRAYYIISSLNETGGVYRFVFADAAHRPFTDGNINGTNAEVYIKPSTFDLLDGDSIIPKTITVEHINAPTDGTTNQVALAVTGGGFTWGNPTNLNRDLPSTDQATIAADDLIPFVDTSDTSSSQKIQFQSFTGALGTAFDGRYEPKFTHALEPLSTLPNTAISTGSTQLTGNVLTASSGQGWGFYDNAGNNGSPVTGETFTTGFPTSWAGFFTGTRSHISFNLAANPGNTLFVGLYNGHVGNENIYLLASSSGGGYAIWKWNPGAAAQNRAVFNGASNTPRLITSSGTPGTSGTDTITWRFNLTTAGAIVAITSLATSNTLVRRADDSWGQVGTAQLADNSVTSAKIVNGTIATADIADDAITQAKIGDDAVGADQLASAAVVTASIVDANVTADKLADNSVVESKISDGSVTHTKIGLDAVNAENLDFAAGVTPTAGQAITIAASNEFSVSSLELELSTPYVPIYGQTNWPASVTASRALNRVARVDSGTALTSVANENWGTYTTNATTTNDVAVSHWQDYFDTASDSQTNVIWDFGGTAQQAAALATAMNTDSNTRIIAAWADEDNWCIWDLSSHTSNLKVAADGGQIRSVPGVNFEDYILAVAGVPQSIIGWAMYTDTGTNYLATGTPLRAATGGDDLAWSSGRRWVKFIGSDGGVGSFHLADGAVTRPKIAGNAVDSTKIANGAVGNIAIADGAVDSIKLATGIANNSGASFATDTLAKSFTLGNTHYRFIDVVQGTTSVNLVNDEADSQAQISAFSTTVAGVVPSTNQSMVPNWAEINAGTFAVTEDLAYNNSLVTDGGRGWVKFNGSNTTTLTEGTTTWQNLLFASGAIVFDDQLRFDDANLSTNVINQITNDTDGAGTFIVICDHDNWAIVRYDDGTGDVFGTANDNSHSYAQSGRTGGTPDGMILAQKGMPRSHARIYLPFNAVSGAKVTNLAIAPSGDDQFLAADGRFVEAQTLDLSDPTEFVQEVDSTVSQTIHRDTDGNVLRVVKEVRYGDFRQDVTVVFVRTAGQVTSVTYNHGDFGASGTIPAAHLVATKTITRTSGSVSSVSIA